MRASIGSISGGSYLSYPLGAIKISYHYSHHNIINFYCDIKFYVRKPYFDFLAGGAVASLEAGDWPEELAAAGD